MHHPDPRQKPRGPDAQKVPTPYWLIHAEETPIACAIDMHEEPSLAEIQAVIGRHFDSDVELERVRVLHDGQYCDMFVDEVGHLKGLPRNDRATEIYRHNWLTNNPGSRAEDLPWIAGTAVLFFRPVWF